VERARRRFSKGALQWNSLQVVLFCIGVAAAFILIFLFSRFHIPGVF